ncbi:hypothetical protein G9A89_019505 [Geosiphon pyriformis]|nr:hypothetical protein G9A89_019505 [Geosiphon pyriformis]
MDAWINKLANLFTTIKQGDTEAVTTYLEHFYRNLHQIQAIQADYFTAPQILNQFIRGLHSNLLQDFEAAELEANHAQAVNLVMNRLFELDSKLKQFSESINQKLEKYLADNFRCGSQKHVSTTTVVNMAIFELIAILIATNDWEINTETLITTTMTLGNLRPRIAQNWRSAMVVYQLISSSSHQSSGFRSRNSGTGTTQNPNFQNYLSLLVTPENATPNNQELEQTPTSNIPPATITEDEFLDTIFPFELKKLLTISLFSGVALEEKPITAMYTNVKIDGHLIKLILNSGSADSIIT